MAGPSFPSVCRELAPIFDKLPAEIAVEIMHFALSEQSATGILDQLDYEALTTPLRRSNATRRPSRCVQTPRDKQRNTITTMLLHRSNAIRLPTPRAQTPRNMRRTAAAAAAAHRWPAPKPAAFSDPSAALALALVRQPSRLGGAARFAWLRHTWTFKSADNLTRFIHASATLGLPAPRHLRLQLAWAAFHNFAPGWVALLHPAGIGERALLHHLCPRLASLTIDVVQELPIFWTDLDVERPCVTDLDPLLVLCDSGPGAPAAAVEGFEDPAISLALAGLLARGRTKAERCDAQKACGTEERRILVQFCVPTEMVLDALEERRTALREALGEVAEGPRDESEEEVRAMAEPLECAWAKRMREAYALFVDPPITHPPVINW